MPTPWLTIIGVGENGAKGLCHASRIAIEGAEIVMGSARLLALLPWVKAQVIPWPIPFAHGIPLLLEQRGRAVVMLASGDPFWFGAGSVITRHLEPQEWVAHPSLSTFSLAAARLGWPLEDTPCLGLHAAPLTGLRPHLYHGARLLVLLRGGESVPALAEYLGTLGFPDSVVSVLESLGGAQERVRTLGLAEISGAEFRHPLAVGLQVRGAGTSIPLATGRADSFFAHDGQLTKSPMRALVLSALAPCPGQHLWDIGAGAGSVAIEWLWAHKTMRATAIEADPERARRIGENAHQLGCDRLEVISGVAPAALEGLARPDAVFIGGGLSVDMLCRVWEVLPAGGRLVANAVSLESESLLGDWHKSKGGALWRIAMAQAAPLGRKRGWRHGYPLVQWSITK